MKVARILFFSGAVVAVLSTIGCGKPVSWDGEWEGEVRPGAQVRIAVQQGRLQMSFMGGDMGVTSWSRSDYEIDIHIIHKDTKITLKAIDQNHATWSYVDPINGSLISFVKRVK